VYFPDSLNTSKAMHCTGPVSIFEDTARIRELFGGCDGGSLLSISLDLLDGDGLGDKSKLFLNLWPPGLSILHTFQIFFLGDFIPIIFFYILLYIFILSIVYTLFIYSHRDNLFFGLLAFLFSIFFVFSSPVKGWFFESGILYQETFAFIFLVIGFLISFRISISKEFSFAPGILIGICFGIASYFRSSLDLFNQALILSSSIILVILLALKFLHKNFSNFSLALSKMLLGISLGIVLVTIPWRIYLASEIHQGNFSWTVYGGIWKSRWTPSQIMIEQGLGPWVDSGMNLGCQIDNEKCLYLNQPNLISQNANENFITSEEFYRNELIGSILSNPLEYLKNRSKVFILHWFTDNKYNYLEKSNFYEGLFLGLLVIITFFMVIYLGLKNLIISNLIWVLLIFSTLAPLSVFHIEARYLIFLKLISIFVFIENFKYIYLKNKKFKINPH
jgi:hypothetical protein